MTRQGFMDRVLLSLTRLTAEERENVRRTRFDSSGIENAVRSSSLLPCQSSTESLGESGMSCHTSFESDSDSSFQSSASFNS